MDKNKTVWGGIKPKSYIGLILLIILIIDLAALAFWWIDVKLSGLGNANLNSGPKLLSEDEINKIMSAPADKTTIISDSKLKKIMSAPLNSKANLLTEEEINKIMRQQK